MHVVIVRAILCGCIVTVSCTPFQSSRCKFTRSDVAATCTSFVAVQATEAALKQAVGTIGPIAIAVDASPYSFRYETAVSFFVET